MTDPIYRISPDRKTLYVTRPNDIPEHYWREQFTSKANLTCWDALENSIDRLRVLLIDTQAKINLEGSDRTLLKRRYYLQRVIGRLKIVLEKRPRPETVDVQTKMHQLQAQQRRQAQRLDLHEQALRKLDGRTRFNHSEGRRLSGIAAQMHALIGHQPSFGPVSRDNGDSLSRAPTAILGTRSQPETGAIHWRDFG